MCWHTTTESTRDGAYGFYDPGDLRTETIADQCLVDVGAVLDTVVEHASDSVIDRAPVFEDQASHLQQVAHIRDLGSLALLVCVVCEGECERLRKTFLVFGCHVVGS